MWISFYFCGKSWCNVDNFVDRMWITSLFLNLLEIKQNELIRINTYNLRSIQVRPDINSPVLFQTSQFLFQKYFTLLDNVQFSKTLITRGILHFQKIRPSCQKGNVFHSHLPLKFQPPDHFPQSPHPPPQNTQKSFDNYFDAPSKSPLFPTTFSSLKIPQSHRITLKSHPKITKSQIKLTHSRTKSNNPIPTT